jgi:hypothetical protein
MLIALLEMRYRYMIAEAAMSKYSLKLGLRLTKVKITPSSAMENKMFSPNDVWFIIVGISAGLSSATVVYTLGQSVGRAADLSPEANDNGAASAPAKRPNEEKIETKIIVKMNNATKVIADCFNSSLITFDVCFFL